MRTLYTLVLALILVARTHAQISDALAHPPPSTGAFAYNSFVPATTAGATYVDPVFGSTVRRVTTDHVADDLYARNMWWSADATRYLHNGSIIDTLTGAVTHTGITSGSRSFDRGFDPVDPNVLFYFVGATVHQVTLGAGGTFTDAVYLTLPSASKNLGGTINWMDASGRYMVVRYGTEPSVHVYDRQNLAAGPYAGAVSGTNVEAGGYIGLTPDGRYIVSGVQAWSIDHAARTVSQAGTKYWDLCGDHGSFISASDGRNYKITSNCNDANEFWRVDITNNVAGQTPAAQKAAPHNLRLLTLPSWDFAQHVTSVARGALRDWAFVSVEDITDDFNGPLTPWLPYRSELIGLNAMTGEVRRLVHHRSRSVDVDYFYQPRLSSSWGGELLGWASNFNRAGETDVYVTPAPIAVPATTYYLAPTGSDATACAAATSSATPKASFASAWGCLAAGDTLIVANGSYSNASPPVGKSGTAGAPITIQAQTDGGASLGALTIKRSSYLTFVGFKVTGATFAISVSSGNLAGSASHHLVFQRIGWTCTQGGGDDACFGMGDGTHHVLIEDSWGWGKGRYQFVCYGGNGGGNPNLGCDNNTFRRVVVRQGPDTSSSGNPQAGFALYYGNSNLVENVIVLDSVPASNSSNAAFYLTAHGPPPNNNANRFFGVLALNNKGIGLYLDTSGGVSNATELRNSVIWASDFYDVALVASSCTGTVLDHVTVGKAGSGDGFRNDGCGGTTLSNSIWVNNKLAGTTQGGSGSIAGHDGNLYFGNGSGKGNLSTGAGEKTSDPQLKYIARVEPGTPCAGSCGATITERYQDGVLTAVPIWPWPNEARIKADMCVDPRGFCAAPSLTDYVWNALGNGNPYSGTPPPPTVAVPAVVGQTQAAAQTAIVGAGLAVGTVTSAPNQTVPSGVVSAQVPAGGAVVAVGSAVALTVSSGVTPPPVTATVPAVVGTARPAAEAAIVAAGLAVGAVASTTSPTVPVNVVLTQLPAGGTVVPLGSSVALTISAGPVPPPTTPAAPSVSTKPASCSVTLTTVPPDSQTGWRAQFTRDGVAVGSRDSTAPYSRTTTVALGSHTYTVIWTRTGSATVVSAPATSVCQ